MSPPPSARSESPRPSVGSIPRHQARSAGMAGRPGRNENLSDLVRFFQTQNMPAPPAMKSPDSTTALPAVQSQPKDQTNKEQLKPLHRRLLQFTQRQKKDSSSSPKSKEEEQQRQIEALRSQGYLSSKPSKTTSSSRSTSSKKSVDSSSIRSKRHDVKKNGRQPCLESQNRDSPKTSDDNKRRLASLDLGDFGSIGDVAVSLTSTDDSSHSPYQPSASNASQTYQGLASQSTSALPQISSSAETRPPNTHRPASSLASTVDTRGSGSGDAFTHRPSNSTDSSIRVMDRVATPSTQAPNNPPANARTIESSDQSVKSDPKQEQDPNHRVQTPGRLPPNPPGPSAQPGLKLFPAVSPRDSSKRARRLSATPRYQSPAGKSSGTKDAQAETPATVKPADKEQSSDNSLLKSTKDEVEPVCSGALVPLKESTESSKAENSISETASQGQNKSRSQPLPMGTLQAFPLPAPTRPLPSIPDAKSPPSAPLDVKAKPTIQVMRSGSGLRIMDLQPLQPSSIAEHPREFESRPATALGYAGEGDAAADHESLHSRTSQERPRSTEPEPFTPRRRASSVRIPRMHDLHESPTERDGDQRTPGQPIADSPLLGHHLAPTKPHVRKGLHINSQIDRRNLPFGLPSPPPTAALPTDPPQASLERSASHRNFTAPYGIGAPSTRNLDAPFGQGLHRASVISRSNSSHSSLRHESIPEPYKPNRCESPIPSSDDEGFGPASQTMHRRRRSSEQYPKRRNSVHRGYETVDARPSHGRLPFPYQTRPLSPQGCSSHSLKKAASQSQYSQSTYRSRDSESSYRNEAGRGSANFLEDRVANLERHNQILQAALMAALNAGAVKNHMDDMPDASMSPMFPPAGMGNRYQNRSKRPESWVSSSHSSEHSGYETSSSLRDRRADVRQLDNMIEDIESGWLSDKSSLSGHRMARHR